MTILFMWADGKLDYTTALAAGHFSVLQRMRTKKMIPGIPQNYVTGTYNFNTNDLRIDYAGGVHPDENELKLMLGQDAEKYQERYQYTPPRLAASVEDTEPEFNLSFLEDPHEYLYPPVWDNDKMLPDAKKKLKQHVMDVIEKDKFKDADNWIYFTVFGSGASYNWDEDGDFDIQMWIDVDKYNNIHGDEPMTSDELVSQVRALVQSVNFPSFAELDLTGPEGKDGSEGRMLVQYYPQPGTGSSDENLAKKPYACYDMETDEWLVHPKPYDANFYGEHFLAIQNKANDIAQQSEQLIDDLQRSILSFQFWSGLYNKYKADYYKDAAEESKKDAETQKAGVAVLFEGVFKGRSEAYSPTGEGIEDEKDACQKFLEVWGIFQKLKHYARAPLPWDEQEMPVNKEASYGSSGTFAYLNGHLLIAYTHHQAIMGALLKNGWTWDDLMQSQQAWGWYWNSGGIVSVKFTSDSGFQHKEVQDDVLQAFKDKFHTKFVQQLPYNSGVIDSSSYGKGLNNGKHLEEGGKYTPEGYFYDHLDTVMADPIPPAPGFKPKPNMSDDISKAWLQRMYHAAVEKVAIKWEKDYYKAHNLTSGSAFGFIDGHLIIGNDTGNSIKHHQIVIAKLLHEGWTWEQLFNAPQAWGWMGVTSTLPQGTVIPPKDKYNYDKYYMPKLQISFASDAGVQNDEAMKECVQKFVELYHMPVEVESHLKQVETEEDYGKGLAGKHNIDYYLSHPNIMEHITVPPPPDGPGTPGTNQLKEKSKPEVEKMPDSGLYNIGDTVALNGFAQPGKIEEVDPTLDNPYWIKFPDGTYNWFNHSELKALMKPVPGGGNPPPKKTPSSWNQIPSEELEGSYVHKDGVPITVTPSTPNKSSVIWHLKGKTDGPHNINNSLIKTWIDQGHWIKTSSIRKTADWNDIMDKARRLKNNQQVQITVNEPDHVVGTVQGDHDTYQTEIWRDDPQSQAITMWDCDCKWDQYSWGRTRQWKKYEGRPCSHTLALFWQAQQTPVSGDLPAQTPPTPVPGGGMIPNQSLMSPVPQQSLVTPLPIVGGPEPEPATAGPPSGPPAPPAMSQITTPQNAEGTISLPGAFSHVKQAAFENGQKVRNKYDVMGEDKVTSRIHRIPQNSAGEVIYSDDIETIVIFPLAGSYHSPHLVKVEGLTYEFYEDPNVNPFIKKKGFLEYEDATSPFEEADIEVLA